MLRFLNSQRQNLNPLIINVALRYGVRLHKKMRCRSGAVCHFYKFREKKNKKNWCKNRDYFFSHFLMRLSHRGLRHIYFGNNSYHYAGPAHLSYQLKLKSHPERSSDPYTFGCNFITKEFTFIPIVLKMSKVRLGEGEVRWELRKQQSL